jgi:hypothetical protein
LRSGLGGREATGLRNVQEVWKSDQVAFEQRLGTMGLRACEGTRHPFKPWVKNEHFSYCADGIRPDWRLGAAAGSEKFDDRRRDRQLFVAEIEGLLQSLPIHMHAPRVSDMLPCSKEIALE